MFEPSSDGFRLPDRGSGQSCTHYARLRRWFSSLSRGVKWVVGAVVTAGAIATAIGAIVALWPDPTQTL